MEDERRPEESRSRRKPQSRNSKAAQVAQRRREERQERAHLENLRQKQTKKAKKQNKARRRISRAAIKRILIMLGILLALILSMIIFFRVRDIQVQGSAYYTDEEIIDASGLEEGDNLLTLSRADVAGNIMAKCPYVASVRVVRQLPDTIQIIIEEFDATYAVRDSKGENYLITAGGKVTEKVDAVTASQHIIIKALTIQTPTIGEMVKVMAPTGQEINAQGQLDALLLVLQQIEAQELLNEITTVSVPNSFEITLQYTDRFVVTIGDTSDLEYKINYLKKVIDGQKSYATGTIDLTQAIDGKAYVMLDQE